MNKTLKKNTMKTFSNVDYKNSNLLKQFINSDGKILPKFLTLLTPKDQRKLSKSIKTSRIVGLLKFVNN